VSGATRRHVAYRAGQCARCGQPIVGEPRGQEVRLDIIGPSGVVAIYGWLDRQCQPTPAAVPAASRELARCLIGWYRSTHIEPLALAEVDHA